MAPAAKTPKRRWRKAPPALVAVFDAALPAAGGVERRTMFGYPCAFVNGNMFTGMQEHRIVVRLAEAERARLLAEPGATPFEPMPGRVMREYVVVPKGVLADPAALKAWLQKAFRYAGSLAPKTPRRRAPAARSRA